MSINIPILTFNDVYRVSQRYVPQPGAPNDIPTPTSSSASTESKTISVSQFGELLLSQRNNWPNRQDRDIRGGDGDEGFEKDGLVLFAGDVFNPSVESSVTRGSHMVSLVIVPTLKQSPFSFDLSDRA